MRGKSKKSPRPETLAELLERRAAETPKKSPTRKAIDWLLKWISPNLPAQLIPAKEARGLFDFWEEEFSQNTAYAYSRAIHATQRWLAQRLKVPEKKLPYVKPGAQRTTRPSEDEVSIMLAKAEPALKLVLLLCAHCGLRSGEAMRIAPADFNEKEKQIVFTQKGKAKRTSYVTDEISQLFHLAQDTGEPLTPYTQRLAGERPFTFAVMQARWRKLKKQSGVNPKLHMHDLRRYIATRAYEATKDLRVAQQLLGHKSLASTLRYIAPFDAPKLQPLIESLRTQRGPIQ